MTTPGGLQGPADRQPTLDGRLTLPGPEGLNLPPDAGDHRRVL